ncbi:hypothetical protein KR032_010852, partial [Drosophila birchii]
ATAGQDSGSEKDKEPERGTGPSTEQSQRSYPCPICLMPFDDPVITDCGHIYCFACLSELVSRSITYPRCPLCR